MPERATGRRGGLFWHFVLTDVCAFVLLAAMFLWLGAPEAIPAFVCAYFLGFQTGSEADA